MFCFLMQRYCKGANTMFVLLKDLIRMLSKRKGATILSSLLNYNFI